MVTWRSVGVSLTGEFITARGVFLFGGIDPDVKNVMGARSMWLPLASSVLLRSVIKNESELRPSSSHVGPLASHNQGLFQTGNQT